MGLLDSQGDGAWPSSRIVICLLTFTALQVRQTPTFINLLYMLFLKKTDHVHPHWASQPLPPESWSSNLGDGHAGGGHEKPANWIRRVALIEVPSCSFPPPSWADSETWVSGTLVEPLWQMGDSGSGPACWPNHGKYGSIYYMAVGENPEL